VNFTGNDSASRRPHLTSIHSIGIVVLNPYFTLWKLLNRGLKLPNPCLEYSSKDKASCSTVERVHV
jgi:hypothetical protein